MKVIYGWTSDIGTTYSSGTGPSNTSNNSSTQYYLHTDSSSIASSRFTVSILKSPSLTIFAKDPIIQVSKPLKSTKYNYISTINPKTISQISGTITNLAGTQIVGNQDSRLIMDFLIKPCL